jgi:LmbE family N-acetylglucosaminyl deacetylase
MLESVGFEIVAFGRAGRNHVVAAKRLPSVHGTERRPFPPCGNAVESYRARHAEAVRARERWRQRHGPVSAPETAPISDWATRAIVVFAPHPDDELIGCGGTLMDIRAAGGSITIVQVTDGSDSAAFISETEDQRRTIRIEEARTVAGALGVTELVCLHADNRAFAITPELGQRVRGILERVRPGLVFLPSFTDIHPDHQVVLRLLSDAMREMKETPFDIALYEVWSLVAPTHVHDVTPRMTRLEELLLRYETALKVDDYVRLVAERLLFNSCEHRARPGYLEAFHVIPAGRFLAIASGHFAGAA